MYMLETKKTHTCARLKIPIPHALQWLYPSQSAEPLRMILYPAIDILGGNAVRLVQGRLRREQGVRPGPAGGGPPVGARKAPSTCTWWTSTARARAPGEPRPCATGGERARRAGAARRRAAHAGGDRTGARGRRRARDPRYRRVHRPRPAGAGAGGARAAARAGVGGRARRPGGDRGLDGDDRDDRRAGRGEPARAGGGGARLHQRRPRWDA